MADYDPKSKLPTTWRVLGRRLPRHLTKFQLFILGGFVSLLILRSSVGIRNYNIISGDDRAMVEPDMPNNLDLTVEHMRNLAQQVQKHETEVYEEPEEQILFSKKTDGLLSEEEVAGQDLDVEAEDAAVVEKLATKIETEKTRLDDQDEDNEAQLPEEVVDELDGFGKLVKDVATESSKEEPEDLADLEKLAKNKLEMLEREKQNPAKVDPIVQEVTQKNDKKENVEIVTEDRLDEKLAEENFEEAVVDVNEEKVHEIQEEQPNPDNVDETKDEESKEEGNKEEETKEEEPKVPVVLTKEDLINLRRQAMENMAKVTRRDDENAYVLGPRISDWDEQRAAWLDRNPHMRSDDPHKPKTLLVTGSQPWPCPSASGDHYLLKMIKNKVDYTRIHQIDVFYNFAHLDRPMSYYWAKLPLIRKMMLSHPESEWIFWMDSDAMFTDMVFEIPFEKYNDYNIVMWGYDYGIYEERSWVACNTGVMFLRNNQWTLDLLDHWVHMGPDGEIRIEAGKVLTSYLTSRPDMMADDQSALVYLMLTREEELRPKIKLEWDYWLSGYWADIVDKYEEFTAKSHPGAGGSDYPYTTHFTGCQPCSGHTAPHYDHERCLNSMERAFNFADNQVLKSLGFEHESLSSSTVLRIRNETSDPLVTVPTDNPWAVGSFYST